MGTSRISKPTFEDELHKFTGRVIFFLIALTVEVALLIATLTLDAPKVVLIPLAPTLVLALFKMIHSRRRIERVRTAVTPPVQSEG